MNVIVYGLNYVRSVALSGAAFNPSWHLTDAITVQATDRHWLNLLQDGDVIFIRISNALYRRVAEVSRSWESHVGIVFSRQDGSWWVAESTVPVSKFTPVEKFVARSEHGRFLIRRFKDGLSAEEKLRLRRSSESRMGRFYHLGFKYDSSRLYCSKFVYDAFQEATGHQVGRLQTFRELLSENPQANLGFWRVWFFGFIPWKRRCVTTTSQLKAANFVTVLDSVQFGNQAAHISN